MSDPVRCEKCGTVGRRRSGYLAPKDWLYMEMTDDTDGTEYVVWTCSEDCSRTIWKLGPGPRQPLCDWTAKGTKAP